MVDDQIRVTSTSGVTAEVEPITLRESSERRLVFRATLVENQRDAAASVNGVLFWERKRAAETWAPPDEVISLTTLRAGEGVRIDMNAETLANFYQGVGALYRLMESNGNRTPVGDVTYVRADRGSLKQIVQLLSSDEGSDLIAAFAEWAGNQNVQQLAESIAGGPLDELLNFDAAIGSARLRAFIREAEAGLESNDEAYWHDLLERHAWVLSHVFAFPVLIVRDEVYVGGKTVANRGGAVADYLYRNALTNNALLVEIKTPMTPLLPAAVYRTGGQVYAPSPELGGAVQQAISNGELIRLSYPALIAADPEPPEFIVAAPRLMLVIGTMPTDAGRRRSFERFRNSLRNLDVITFDELLTKVRLLLGVIEGQ